MASVAAETTTGEAQLYEQHSHLVFRYCLRTLGSREDAEDATQTTFFQALRAMRRGVVPRFEQAWLLTIAKNECKTRHRAGSRRRLREVTQDPQTLSELAEAPGNGDGRLVGVQQALARLPETQRRALLLREWQGRPYAEIARELGVSRPAVEALLFRARRSLARELGEDTGMRRHAFDLASLLSALKALFGGSAAVKVAVGVAAVATMATVAVSDGNGPAPTIGGRQQQSTVDRAADPSTPRKSVRAEAGRSERASRLRPVARSADVSKVAAPTDRAKPPVTAAPAAPTVEGAAPAETAPSEAPASQAPQAPVVPQAPATPTAPQVPQPPAPLPQLEAPPPPPLPQAPQLPAVPPAPPLPAVPELSPLPEVPGLPDVPALPDVPTLP